MNRRTIRQATVLVALSLATAAAGCGPAPAPALESNPGHTSAAVTTPGLAFYPLAAPVRLLDTRPGRAATYAPGTPLRSSSPYTYSAASAVPATAQGLVTQVTLLNYRAQICTYDLIYRDSYCHGDTTQTDNVLYPRVDFFAAAADWTFQPGGRYVQVGSGPLRPTAELVTLPLSGTRTFSLGVESGQRLPEDPYNEGRSYDFVGTTYVDAIVDIVGYYAPAGQAGALYLHLFDTQLNLVSWCGGNCYPVPPISLGGTITGGVPATITARGTYNRGNGSGTFTIPASASYLVGSLTARDYSAHTGSTVYTNVYPVGAARPDTGLAVTDQGGESGQYLVKLSTTGAFQIAASTPTYVSLEVAGYFSADPNDDGNGRGLLFNLFPRFQMASSGQIDETDFAVLPVRGTGLMPPEAVAFAGRLVQSAGGESAGSTLSVAPSVAAYIGSWGSDVLGTGYPESVDEATFVRRIGGGGSLAVGPGSPDLTYARGALDAAGYYTLAP